MSYGNKKLLVKIKRRENIVEFDKVCVLINYLLFGFVLIYKFIKLSLKIFVILVLLII